MDKKDIINLLTRAYVFTEYEMKNINSVFDNIYQQGYNDGYSYAKREQDTRTDLQRWRVSGHP